MNYCSGFGCPLIWIFFVIILIFILMCLFLWPGSLCCGKGKNKFTYMMGGVGEIYYLYNNKESGDESTKITAPNEKNAYNLRDRKITNYINF